MPAMGSHGGATAAGQIEVLAGFGITPDSVGAPVQATMDVVRLGAVGEIPLCLDRFAAGADGIVLVNRVKPHTDFAGPMGSGLMKMLCIGLGNQEGADRLHRQGVARDLGEIVREAAVALLGLVPVLFGVAILENQHHRACEVRLVPGSELEAGELALQEVARGLLPGLPLDDIDLLIVDEMGKDISGAGLDPNVIGRALGPWQVKRDRPRIADIRAGPDACFGGQCLRPRLHRRHDTTPDREGRSRGDHGQRHHGVFPRGHASALDGTDGPGRHRGDVGHVAALHG